MENKAILPVVEDILCKPGHSKEVLVIPSVSSHTSKSSNKRRVMLTPPSRSLGSCRATKVVRATGMSQRDTEITVIPGELVPEHESLPSQLASAERQILTLRRLVSQLANEIQRKDEAINWVVLQFAAGHCGAVAGHVENTKRMVSNCKGALAFQGRDEIVGVCPFCNQNVSKEFQGGR